MFVYIFLKWYLKQLGLFLLVDLKMGPRVKNVVGKLLQIYQ